MSATAVVLVAFLASAVEMVEAATIVLAIELTRGRAAALTGCLAALALLTLSIVVMEPLLSSIPLGPLRFVVGALALVFGLDWLRKAILRHAGVKSLHDEAAIFEEERQRTTGAFSQRIAGIDRLGFIVSFKAVLLEGLEVVVIVITLGSAQRHVASAALGALVALVVVAVSAVALRRPLTRVPENTMKMVVGVMLVSFGTFWGLEGAGGHWPGDAIAIPALAAWYAAAALGISHVIRRQTAAVA